LTVTEALEIALADLPEDVRRYVGKRIRWEVRPSPTPEDIALGASPTDQGLFVGRPLRGEDDDEGGELFDQGDDVGHAQGAPEYTSADGDDVAEVESQEPGGRIILYTSNIKPLDAEHVAAVVLHELAHFLGETEEGVFELGLA
jgi:Zn-dependent protease with chaperone function